MTDSTEPRAEGLWSVMYRTGPITPADYQEAANEMTLASLQENVAVYGCAICADGGHTAGGCHHNILIAARKWAAATSIYVCYHCGFVATNDEEAKDHFGANDEEPAKCTRPTTDTVERAAVLAAVEDNMVVGDDGLEMVDWSLARTAIRALPSAAGGEDKLREALHGLCSAYESLLEKGHSRIIDLGGMCDSPDIMIASDPYLAKARAALQQEHTK